MKSQEFNLVNNRINRSIDKNHVKSLVKSMSTHGFFEGKPIQVNKDFIIIDGHHRYAAAKQLNIPYSFVIENVSDKDIDSIGVMKDLNMTQRKYTLNDWCDIYSNSGNIQYQYLLRIKKTYSDIPFSTIYKVVGKSQTAPSVRDGSFIIEKDNLFVLDYYLWFRENTSISVCNQPFAIALLILGRFDVKLIDRLKQNVAELLPSPRNLTICIVYLLKIINFRRHKRVDYRIVKGKINLFYV